MADNTYLKTTLAMLISFVALCFSGTTQAGIIYVDDDGPADFSSIQAAIDSSVDGDIVEVRPGLYFENINFMGKNITLRSTEPDNPDMVAVTVIDGGQNGSVVTISGGEDCVLNGFTITNGYAGFGGGVNCGWSSPTLMNCTFSRNTATSRGGGVHGGNLTMLNCTFKENSATYYGGGINNSMGTLTNCTFISNSAKWGGGTRHCDTSSIVFTECTFIGNSAEDGGGMYNDESDPTLINCTFSGNSAYDNGGGMYNSGSSPTLTNCAFSGNSASSSGGGLYNHGFGATLTDCTFQGNNAGVRGGGMYNYNSSPTLTNCTFSGNTASSCGGGLHNYLSNPTLTNCTLSGNSAEYDGGGMYDEGNPTLINCSFTANTAREGGGMFSRLPTSNPTLINCKFSANSATVNGGGMSVHGSNPTLFNCTFTGNTSYRVGGAMQCGGGYPTLTNCTFTGNTAGLYVGGMSGNDDTYPTLTNCILWNNSDSGGMDEYAQFGVYRPQTAVNYSCIQGWTGALGGSGNIGDDPLFVDPNNDDYHLLTSSPCIDAGDPNYIAEPNETDLDGRPRVIGGRIDMGAYEYSPPIPAEARIVPRSINLESKGNWITCYIWLGEDYNVADIEPNSVFLEGEIEAESFQVDEEQQVAVVRFSRSDVQKILNVGEVELTITGRLTDGTVFEATDIIKVIEKGG